jgi:hypothetical protein
MAKQSFVTGQVLTAAQLTSLQQTAMSGGAASAKTTSYVLVAADAGTAISMTSTSATTITVNTGLFAAGDTVFIQNLGSATCTITAGTATVNTAGSLILPQYDAGILYFVSSSSAVFYDYIQVGATSPLTTKGDLYGFGTSDARIPIGANNTVLTADSGQTLGVKWAAASSGALTKIASASFTTQSSVSVNGCFSSTYKTYCVIWQANGSAGGADLQLQFQYSTSTAQTSDYYFSGFGYKSDNSLITYGANNTSAAVIYNDLGTTATYESFGIFYVDGADGTSNKAGYFGNGYGQGSQANINFAGKVNIDRTYTGFLLKPDSGTITGRYQVYGLEN